MSSTPLESTQSFRIHSNHYGYWTVGPVPVEMLTRLLTPREDEDEDEVVLPGVAHALGASFAWTFKTEAENWIQAIREHLVEEYPDNPEMQWICGPDTGLSSRTVFRVLAKTPAARVENSKRGNFQSSAGHFPMDSSDFDRVVAVVAFCDWHHRLGELKALGACWEKLVDNWDHWVALLLKSKDKTVSKDTRLTAFKELHAAIQGANPRP